MNRATSTWPPFGRWIRRIPAIHPLTRRRHHGGRRINLLHYLPIPRRILTNREFNEGLKRHQGGANMRGNHGDIFGDMDSMMNNMMRGFGSDMGMLEGGGRDRRDHRSSGRDVAERRPNPRSFFPDMGSLTRQLDEMSRSGDGYSFSSQQVYGYRKDGTGEPQEFQATSSTAKGPGGVKETKKGFKESTTKTQKMQYGRHIGDRATIQERSQVRDRKEEKTDYVGFSEERAPQFDSEWRSKAGSLYTSSFGADPSSRNRQMERPGRSNKQRSLPQPRNN